MTVLSSLVVVGANLAAYLFSLLSFVIPLTLLPIILTIDIVKLSLGPLLEDSARTIRKANSFWGWPELGANWPSMEGMTQAAAAMQIAFTGRTRAPQRSSPIGMRRKNSGENTSLSDQFAGLPYELKHEILLAMLLSSDSATTYDCTPLLLCRWSLDAFRPQVYSSIRLQTHRQFRLLRETLAIHNPQLGNLVKSIVIASNSFDFSGYVASPIAPSPNLSTGIEQLLLDMPNLQSLSLDLYSLAALYEGNGNQRLESGPRPKVLRTELTFPQYLDMPVYQDLEELEIMCFGLDEAVARELRSTLPNLKRLVIRLVRRNLEPVGRRGSAGSVLSKDDTDSSDSDDIEASSTQWSDTETGRMDAEEFKKAVSALRSWPDGEERCGSRLESVTVLTFPSAVRGLRQAFKREERESQTVDVTGQVRNEPSSIVRNSAELLQASERQHSMRCRSLNHEHRDERQRQAAPPAPWLIRTPSSPILELQAATLGTSDDWPLPQSSPHRAQGSAAGSKDSDVDLGRCVCDRPAPLRLDIDPYRKLGPRNGSVAAWMDLCTSKKP